MRLIDTGLTCVGFTDGYLMPDELKEELLPMLKKGGKRKLGFLIGEIYDGFKTYKILIGTKGE